MMRIGVSAVAAAGAFIGLSRVCLAQGEFTAQELEKIGACNKDLTPLEQQEFLDTPPNDRNAWIRARCLKPPAEQQKSPEPQAPRPSSPAAQQTEPAVPAPTLTLKEKMNECWATLLDSKRQEYWTVFPQNRYQWLQMNCPRQFERAMQPATPIASDAKPEPTLMQVEEIMSLDPKSYPRVVGREIRQKQRQVNGLQRAMEIEGKEFSQEKYDKYRLQKGWGVTAIVLGGVSLVSMQISCLAWFFGSIGGLFVGDQCGDDDTECANDRQSEHEERNKRYTVFVLTTGIAAVVLEVVGIPLAIRGGSGKRRQELLRQKDQILKGMSLPQLQVSFFGDPENGSGGFGLVARF